MPSRRDNFPAAVRAALAKRAGFHCSICRALTIGPSAESPKAISSVGVAAHITAASPGGKRYNKAFSSQTRSSISNGIWVCETHGKMIDTDRVTWPATRLRDIKKEHEQWVRASLGVPFRGKRKNIQTKGVSAREYAFVRVGVLIPEYKSFLDVMLKDKKLTDDTELGILLSGSCKDHQPDWTTFVNAEWLRWFLKGQDSGFGFSGEIPPKMIYGRVPAWPDTFYEFLSGIVKTNATFVWQRHPGGYLVLSQP